MQNLIGWTYGNYNTFNEIDQLNYSLAHKISESVLKCPYYSLSSLPRIQLYLRIEESYIFTFQFYSDYLKKIIDASDIWNN